jgi:hypothetical protein
MPFSSDSPAALASRGRRMPSALHARDLAQWTGQIVYADPAWTIAACPLGRENWRTAAELAATPDQTAAVVGALRHAAYTPTAGSSQPRRGVPEWREGRGVRHDRRVPTQTEFNPDIPSAARVYDYVLGGKNHYPADREVAEAVLARTPSLRSAVQANRGFLRRAVRYVVAEAGVRQIIDLGAGLPTVGNTHEAAHDAARDARIVYVDHDPVVLGHARNMLHQVSGAAVVRHEIQDTDATLADPELRELINLSEPCAILLVSVLHFIPDGDDPAGIISRLLAPFPSGSCLVMSHATADLVPALKDAVDVAYQPVREDAFLRTRAEVLAMLDGLELVPPGLVWVSDWRPEKDTPPMDAEQMIYGAVGRKP